MPWWSETTRQCSIHYFARFIFRFVYGRKGGKACTSKRQSSSEMLSWRCRPVEQYISNLSVVCFASFMMKVFCCTLRRVVISRRNGRIDAGYKMQTVSWNKHKKWRCYRPFGVEPGVEKMEAQKRIKCSAVEFMARGDGVRSILPMSHPIRSSFAFVKRRSFHSMQ